MSGPATLPYRPIPSWQALADELAGAGVVMLLTNAAAAGASGRGTLARVRDTRPASCTLLTPEHGFAADLPPGVADPSGATRRPFSFTAFDAPDPDLPCADHYLFDLPLVGARYYTHLDGLRRLARVAARQGRALTVLDRPNPLGGLAEGPSTVDPGCRSEVAALELPLRYGLSAGGVAAWLAAREGYPAPRVLPAGAPGWDPVGPFRPPSPNLRSPAALRLYPALCLLEGTTVSEGRGTTGPFTRLGAPDLDAARLARRLAPPEGFTLEEVRFTPTASKHAGRECCGLELMPVGARERSGSGRPAEAPGAPAGPLGPVLPFGLSLLAALGEVLPGGLELVRGPSGRFFLDLLWGSPSLREALEAGRDPLALLPAEPEDLSAFRIHHAPHQEEVPARA